MIASGIVLNDTPTGKLTATTKLTRAIARLNQRVNLATEGTMDLRFLFPLLLALLSLRQMFSKSPRLNTAPWYILAWYAFDSFMKLNSQEDKVATPEMQTNETQTLNTHNPTKNRKTKV
nr:hypothetical protein BH720_16560 [Desertifilum tharense IPPAS B-1220]